jgi:aldehyde:ferredoxin oxidoreductase
MECFERGLLTREDTGGAELHFGDAGVMLDLVEQVARRKGFGEVLAEGSWRAARQIGRGTERYAMHVKGQEMPLHEPRIKFGLDIGYATSPTGADHMHNIHDTSLVREGVPLRNMRGLGLLHPVPADDLGPEKVRLFKYRMSWRLLYNSLMLCMMTRDNYTVHHVCDLVQGVTGWNTTAFELMKVSERTLAMARAFNFREGFTAKDDVAHWRFSTPFESGPAKGVRVPDEDIQRAIHLYYEMSGWDEESGAPTAAKLHELGLTWVAEMLYG